MPNAHGDRNRYGDSYRNFKPDRDIHAYTDSDGNRDIHAYVHAYGDAFSYRDLYPNSDGYVYADTDTIANRDVWAIHYQSDRRQHRARHDRHRQSRG